MSAALNIVVKPTKDQVFNAGLGVLELKKRESFSYTIQAFVDLEKTKPREDKKWNSTKDHEKYNADLKKYEDAKKALIEKYQYLQWVWQLVGNGVDPKLTSHNESFPKGLTKMGADGFATITFSKLLEGGGMVWLEAFDAGSTHPKNPRAPLPVTGKSPRGIFIKASGTPKVLRTAWTDHKYIPIKGQASFGSEVLLNIYTQGLYGEELEIELIDKDFWFFDSNDTLVSKKTALIREVNVYKIDANEYYKEGVSDSLTKAEQKKNDNIVEKAEYIQKIEMAVSISSSWMGVGGTNLKIYPVIKSVKTGKYFENFERVFIEVATNGKKFDIPGVEVSNNPLMVGQVETNVAAFKPCRYDKITGFYVKNAGADRSEDDKKNDSKKTVTIFDSKLTPSKQNLTMLVVAGPKEARREVKITIDAKTSECAFSGSALSHKGKVIDLSKIQEAVVIEERTKANQNRLNETSATKNDSIPYQLGRFGLNFSKEEEGHEDKDDDNDNDASNERSKYSTKGALGVTRESKATMYRDTLKKGYYAKSDAEVVLDIGYDYGSGSVLSLVKHIWPLNQRNTQQYPITLQTCCYTKQLDIVVYPDIKWIVQFAYDCDPDEFQEMRKDKYDKYKVRLGNLKENHKPKSVDEKIVAIDSDLDNAKIGLREADNPHKKKQFTALINKLETKKKKQLEKNKKYQTKYKNKVSREKSQYRKDRKNDLFNFKDNIGSGLSELVISLHAEFDRPAESVELSASYQRYVNLVKQILEVKEMIQLILDGKKKSTKKLDKKYKQIDEKAASEKLAAIGGILKGRPVLSFDIIPPSFAILGSWYAESPKDINQAQVGIVGELEIQAKPFIGAEITMDFIALFQRMHPIARGIITLIDIGASLGAMPKITLEIEVTGEIEINGKWRGNTASGTSNFNQKSLATDAEDDSPLTIGGVFNFILRGKIEISNKFETYIFGSIEAYAEASIEIKSGFTLSGAIKADEKGFYIDPLLTFHGLTVELVLKGGYKMSNNKGGEYSSNDLSREMTLVLINEYEGSFLDSNNQKIQFYLN